MRQPRALALLTVLVAFVLMWTARSGSSRQVFAVPLHDRPNNLENLQVQGVATCASAACHNANGPRGSCGSEYSTWIAVDPHARAYEVLYNERSKQIAKKLWPDEPKRGGHPERETLCRSCHVYPDPGLDVKVAGDNGSASFQRGHRFSASDGVGCEACHGPAKMWLSRHYTDDWKMMSPAQKREFGFVDTKDLAVRAGTCVRCHVGDGGMDVNHDLIAVGHPRLRFEFGAYLANYPKHWKEAADQARNRDHQARAWMIGQFVSAKAALDLLAYRAENSNAKRGRTPWPEFAEYNCAGCHHQIPRTGETAKPLIGKAGDLRWGTWYLSLVPELARGVPGPVVNLDLKVLKEKMQLRVPPEETVAAEARKLVSQIDVLLPSVQKLPALESTWYPVMQKLAGRTNGNGDITWDSAAQVYLGLAALYQGLTDLDAKFAGHHPGLKKALQGLRQPLAEAFPKGRQQDLYLTPNNFDPAQWKRRLNLVGELVK